MLCFYCPVLLYFARNTEETSNQILVCSGFPLGKYDTQETFSFLLWRNHTHAHNTQGHQTKQHQCGAVRRRHKVT